MAAVTQRVVAMRTKDAGMLGFLGEMKIAASGEVR
jgi:hypothetical protein